MKKCTIIFLCSLISSIHLSATFERGDRCKIIKGPDKGTIVRIIGSCKTLYYANSIFELLGKSEELLDKWGILSNQMALFEYGLWYLTAKNCSAAPWVAQEFLEGKIPQDPAIRQLFLEEANGEFYQVQFAEKPQPSYIHASWLEKISEEGEHDFI